MNDLLMLFLSYLFPGIIRSGLLGANILKLAAIIGTMSISFFGMRLWVFLQRASGGKGSPSKKADMFSPVHDMTPDVLSSTYDPTSDMLSSAYDPTSDITEKRIPIVTKR